MLRQNSAKELLVRSKGHSQVGRASERRVTVPQVDASPRGGSFSNGKRGEKAPRAILDWLQRQRLAPNDIAEMIELGDIRIYRGGVDALGLDRLVPILRVAGLPPLDQPGKLERSAPAQEPVVAFTAEREFRRL